jgi:hypothetical protein
MIQTAHRRALRLVRATDAVWLTRSIAQSQSMSNRDATTPEKIGDAAVAGNHILAAVQGRVHDIIWECQECGKRRRDTNAYFKVQCD